MTLSGTLSVMGVEMNPGRTQLHRILYLKHVHYYTQGVHYYTQGVHYYTQGVHY